MKEVDIDRLSRELKKAADKMKNDNAKYTVHEYLEPGHGEGNYKLEFYAKKKGGFSLLSTVANIARGAMYGGIEGVLRRAVYEVSSRKFRATFEPIDQEMTGSEIAALLKRWSETIPKGFIETIGSTLLLPSDPSYISAKIKPGKEIRIVIDFAKLKEIEKKGEIEETKRVSEQVSSIQAQVPSVVPVPTTPPSMMPMLPTILPQIYLVGSLKNIGDGFQFMFHNGLAPVTIVSPIKLIVDGSEIDIKNILIIVGDKEKKSADISPSNPIIFNVGDQLIIRVTGMKLPSGTHNITIKTSLREFGAISFSISDTVS